MNYIFRNSPTCQDDFGKQYFSFLIRLRYFEKFELLALLQIGFLSGL